MKKKCTILITFTIIFNIVAWECYYCNKYPNYDNRVELKSFIYTDKNMDIKRLSVYSVKKIAKAVSRNWHKEGIPIVNKYEARLLKPEGYWLIDQFNYFKNQVCIIVDPEDGSIIDGWGLK